MASTSQKHRDFVRETMGNKPVDALAGIGDAAAAAFKAKGYDKAYHVLVCYACTLLRISYSCRGSFLC